MKMELNDPTFKPQTMREHVEMIAVVGGIMTNGLFFQCCG